MRVSVNMEGVCVVQKESEGFSCVILRIDRDAMACPVCPQERSILLALGKGRAMTGMYESRGTVRASQLSCVRGVALWTDKKVQSAFFFVLVSKPQARRWKRT